VPGVSSALAAPALAGIPVTHRGLASAFVVVSGHAERAWAPVLDGLAPGAATVIVLMGLGSREAIAARLVARGWSALTPAAVLVAASHPDAESWIGTLGDLARDEPRLESRHAGTIVIGDVVSVGRRLAAPAGASERVAAR
jgi:uroporphyrin-III C-methyltransferase/precorrin-2 dehydrogenase/sirohydrochlorin ferrochelatase